jgi:thiamine kinase-like enzyme
MMEEVFANLARVPQFKDVSRERIAFEELGGLTNRNYKVTLDGEAYVLRVAGEGTSEYIDREVEAHNARVAADAGVNAEVVFFDTKDGLMLCRYLASTATMTPETFLTTPGAPARAARVFKRMHDCGRPFKFRFELFSMIDDYLGHLAKLGAALPEGYHDVVGEAEAVRRVLGANPGTLAPCHCDPLCENFLDDGERMWLVDWEYSGMNDPIWDLGDLSVEAGFGDAQDQEMMEAYCGGRVAPAVFGRMVVYKAMCDLLWTLWGLVQLANDNPTDDYWAYSVQRFERCKTLMGGRDFGRHLAAIASGV